MAQVFGRSWARPWRRLRRGDPQPPAAMPTPMPTPAPVLVDSTTRTWWKPGADRSETLVETVAARSADDAIARRVAALTAGSLAAGSLRLDRVPGTADPAFTELLLVELLRAGRWDRAFALLAPACQQAWSSPDALATANAGAARRIVGARVAAVRALDRWEDEDGGAVWEGVAELVVEYAVRISEGVRPMRRTVHLVDVDGRWRSLLFPSEHHG